MFSDGWFAGLTANLEPDIVMVDGTFVKAHQHGTGAVGGNQAIGRTKGGAEYQTALGRSCPWDVGQFADHGGNGGGLYLGGGAA